MNIYLECTPIEKSINQTLINNGFVQDNSTHQNIKATRLQQKY
jgi:hypothetical protein